MAPPSKLTIQTQAVQRLLKEESSYHKEQEAQVGRIQKLEGGEEGGENRDFMLKQEKQSLEETKAVFGPLKKRIADAVARLEQQLADDQSSAPTEEVTKANETLSEAKKSAL